MIKLIALDFDWTLIDHTGSRPNVSAALIERLNKFIENGGIAGVSSGRTLESLKESFAYYGLEWGKSFPNFNVYSEAYLDLPGDAYRDENAKNRERIIGLNRRLEKYSHEWLDILTERGLTVLRWKHPLDYCLEYSMKNIDEAREAEKIISELIKPVEGCAVQRNVCLVSAYDEKSGKGNMVKAAADFYSLTPDEVLTIGDSFNDLTMLDGGFGFNCGVPVNADPALKEIILKKGGYAGCGVAYDGVMDILDHYGVSRA